MIGLVHMQHRWRPRDGCTLGPIGIAKIVSPVNARSVFVLFHELVFFLQQILLLVRYRVLRVGNSINDDIFVHREAGQLLGLVTRLGEVEHMAFVSVCCGLAAKCQSSLVDPISTVVIPCKQIILQLQTRKKGSTAYQ